MKKGLILLIVLGAAATVTSGCMNMFSCKKADNKMTSDKAASVDKSDKATKADDAK